MGCQVSSGGQFEKSDFDNLWKRMNSVSYNNMDNQINKKKSQKQKLDDGSWKILRILLVTTYKDFKNERNAVLELIENRLQPIASEKRIFLQLEDFNFGFKANMEDASTLYLIEKCISQSKQDPFSYIYLHFFGECAGFILDQSFTNTKFLQRHSISPEQSFSEVFLQLAGLNHSESLFLYRNPSFLQELPFNVTSFVDSPNNRERAVYMADTVKNNVPSSKYVEYSVRTSGINNLHYKQIIFDDLTKAIIPIDTLIETYIEDLPYPENQKRNVGIEEIISNSIRNSADSRQFSGILKQINSKIQAEKSVMIIGDYGSGKTSVLHLLAKSLSKVAYIQLKEGMTMMDVRKGVDQKLKVEMEDYNEKGRSKSALLLDDIHLLSKDVSSVFSNYSHLIIVATSRRKKIDLGVSDVEIIQLPNLEPQEVVDELTNWTNDEVKSANILKFSQQKRRKSLGNIENGQSSSSDENVGWTKLKCRVIGSLGKHGNSEEKCAQLAQFSTLSVVEADICLMESDARGHLLIATLCFLTIVENGLNEIELRALLATEFTLLPINIRRNFRNLPFEYCADEFGIIPQIPPLRWYFILNRIEHLLIRLFSSNHFILPSACKRVIHKKFLKTPANVDHFKRRIRSTIIDSNNEILQLRSREIEKEIY